MSLKNKVAIVTGGSRGIGAGIAIELASRGASVLITYATSPSGAASTVSTITAAGGICTSILADCVAEDSPKKVVEAALQLGDGIDIIVNNAGIGSGAVNATEKLTYEFFDSIFYTNVRFPMFLVREALPFLRKGGRIVNMSSVCAREGWAGSVAYGATKAALEAATRTWAKELGHKYEVTSNAVNPGPVATDMWFDPASKDVQDEMLPYINATPAAPRLATVDDIAQIVAFLSEEGSRWVTGNVVCANRGSLLI